ncbi:unnamed protein product [Trichobilharzia regenti]|nr:unnamed protein product [Trichobilharzia regenti]
MSPRVKKKLPGVLVTQSSSLNWVDCQSTDTYPTDIYRDDITFSNLFSEDILVHSSNTVHPIISSSSAVAADDDDDVDDDDNGDANMLCTLQYGTGNNPSVYTTSSECDHYKKCRSYSEYDLFPIKSRHYDDEDYKSKFFYS